MDDALVARPLLPIRNRVQWGPIVAGVLTAIVVFLLLTILGIALGASVLDPANTAGEIGTWAAVWGAFTAIASFLIGGWIAARAAVAAARHEQAYLLAKGHPPRPARPLPDVQPWVYTGNPLHPTQKAVAVIRPLVAAFSQPGDAVLDPFMGSGTTGVACAREGRRFCGIELDAGFFRIAAGRIARAYGDLPANQDDIVRNLGLTRIR